MDDKLVCGLASRKPAMPSLDAYLTIRDAAEFLSVAPNTLRNWGAAGKIPVHRNPMNRYRLFKRSDLEKLLKQVERSAQSRVKPLPRKAK
jgi:MerR family copper efflux transcriptional regulator